MNTCPKKKLLVYSLKFIAVLVALLLTTSYLLPTAFAATGINKQINFQGKVVNANGTNVTNGNYDFVFSIYTVASGGTAIWTETRTAANQVAVTDGIFRVPLGSITALPGSIDFNTDNIYLGINFNGDGEMTPRVQFTAVPQAFNALKVAGLTVTDTTGTFTLAAAKTLTVNNTLTLTGTDATTITFQGTDTYVGRATTDTLTNKTIGTTGLTFSGATTDITTAAGEDLTLVANGAGVLKLGDFTTANGVLYVSATDGTTAETAAATGAQCLQTTGAGLAPVWGSCSGAATVAWSGLTAPTADLALNHAEFTTAFTFDTPTTAAAKDYFTLASLNDATTDSTTQRLLVLNNNDDAISTGATESLLVIDNKDANEAVINAILIANSGGGAFTNYINAPNFTVTNAGLVTGVGVNSGSGLLQGTGGLTITGTTQINVTGTANTTIGNTAGGTITIGAASGSDLALNDANWSVTGAGAATFATVNGLAITNNGTNTLNIGAGLTLGVSTASKTITGAGTTLTFAGDFTTSGANALTLTTTGATNVTLPTSGTLVNSAVTTLSSLTTVGSLVSGTVIGSQTFTTNNIADSGALTIKSGGTSALTLDTSGAAAINLGNTNATSIALGNATTNPTLTLTGSGLTTLGGGLTFSGTSARTITGPNTGAAGALVLTTAGNISGLTLNTAAGSSGNSGAISIQTGGTSVSGTSGAVTIDVGAGATANGTITIGGTNASALTIGRAGVTTTVNGTLSSSGATTLGTGASLTNTFGSGASSINTIGSITTPGALTLHGATTLDNTFTVSGANLTSLGGNLTVTGSAWSATPTISGLITATSGVTVAANQSYTGAGAVTVSSGGSSGLTFDSASGDIAVAANDGLTFAATTVGNNGSRNVTINSGTGGTTATLLVKLDTSGTVVTTDTTVLNNAVGVALNTTTAGQAVRVAINGVVTATADNAVTAGDYIGLGTTTAGRAKSLGTTYPSTAGVQVIGRALGTQATPGSTFLLMLNGLDNNVAAGGGGCSTCLKQAPANTADNTVTVGNLAGTVGLTINSSTNATPADALDINLANTAANTDGVLINQTGSSTTTNALHIKNTSGTVTNGLVFEGTIATDITTVAASNRSLTIAPNGSGSINLTSAATTTNALSLTDTALTSGNALAITAGNPKINNNSGLLTSGKLINVASANHTYMSLDNKDLTIYGHKNNIAITGVLKVFVYDTSKDTDGGRWTNGNRAEAASWYSEARTAADACVIGTNLRCGTQEFPKKAVIVATATTVHIFDAKDNSLWMTFNKGATTTENMIGPTTNSIVSSIFGLNGKLYVGSRSDLNDTTGGLYVINFIRDIAKRYNKTDDYQGTIANTGVATVASRNSAITWTTASGLPLASNSVADIYAQVVNGKQYVAVALNDVLAAANGSVSVVNETDQSVINFGIASNNTASKNVFITPSGSLYATVGNLLTNTNTSPSTNFVLKVKHNFQTIANGSNNQAFGEIYGTTAISATGYGATITDAAFASLSFTNGPAPFDTTFVPNSLFVTYGTSLVNGRSNTIYVGNEDNLMIIQEKQYDPSNGSVKYFNKDNISEEIVGDVRGMWSFAGQTTLTDSSVRAETLTNSATPVTFATGGVRGTAGTFTSASSTQLTRADDANLSVIGSVSFGAWFKTTSATTNQFIISKAGSYTLEVTAGSKVQGIITGATTGTRPSSNSIDTGWHHVVVVYTASPASLDVYLDGVLDDGTLVGTVPSAITDSVNQLSIGSNNGATFFNGQIDEPFITAEALSASQVKQIWKVGYRALQNHSSQTLQQLNGTNNAGNNQVKAVAVDLEEGAIYAGSNFDGGVSVIGNDSDTRIRTYTTANTDDVNAAFGSNIINSISVGQGWGSDNLMVAIGNGAGTYLESANHSLKESFAQSYNPFGSNLTQNFLNVDNIFRVTNPLSAKSDNLSFGNTLWPAYIETLRVDGNGAAINTIGGTITNTANNTYNGLTFNAYGGSITQTGSATTTFNMSGMTLPNITQSAGALTSNGQSITLGTVTTGGTENGLLITPASGGSAAGTITGINIAALTPGAATENGLNIAGGWDTAVNVAPAATTVTSVAAATGLNLDFTNLTATGLTSVIGRIVSPLDTNINNATKTGLSITSGAITQNTAAGVGTYTGLSLALPSVTTTVGTSVTNNGLTITTPVQTQTTALTTNYNGLNLSSAGALATSTTGAGNNINWNGLTLTTPTNSPGIASSAITVNGLKMTVGSLTQTAGTATSNGLNVDMSATTITTGGTLTGLSITPPTTAQAVGTTRSISLGTSTGATANTYDAARIDVGNIASTATNNYSTLELRNGGTGFFDLELVRGMINYQAMNTFLDDFTGRVLDTTTKWTFAVLGTGTCSTTITAAGLNGFLRATTGATIGWGCNLSTQATLSNGFYQRGNNPVFESRVKVTSATIGGVRSMNGFSNASMATTVETLTAGHAWIGKKAADTAWQCVSSDGTTESQTTTGVTIVSGTNYRLRVQVLGGTTPQVICTVDDGTTVTRISKTTNVPLVTTAMDIYEKCETTDTTSDTCDYDYVRAWQDDPPLTVENVNYQNNVGLETSNHSTSESASLVATISDAPPASEIVLNASADGKLVIRSKDGENKIIFDQNGNATFKGMVTADKIKADSIEGLEILTNKISSLQGQVAGLSVSKEATSSSSVILNDSEGSLTNVSQNKSGDSSATPQNDNSNKSIEFESGKFTLDLIVLGRLETQGGLIVGGPAEFNNDTIFNSLAQFISKVIFKDNVLFEGRPTFNKDTAGFAVIKKDADKAEVTFEKEYAVTPAVNVNMTFDPVKLADGSIEDSKVLGKRVAESNYSYLIMNRDTRGFTIVLNKNASEDITFSWTALSVKDAKRFESKAEASPSATPTVNPVATSSAQLN